MAEKPLVDINDVRTECPVTGRPCRCNCRIQEVVGEWARGPSIKGVTQGRANLRAVQIYNTDFYRDKGIVCPEEE